MNDQTIIPEQLKCLASLEYEVKCSPASTAAVLRAQVSRTDEYKALREMLRNGTLTEQTVEAFVSQLMMDFEIGVQFPYRATLATLIVLFENIPSDFAERLLRDFARLKLSEIRLVIDVAKESLQRKNRQVKTERRVFTAGPAPFRPLSTWTQDDSSPRSVRVNTRSYHNYAVS